MFKWGIAVALLASAQVAAAAKPIGIVTILEGRATVIRALSQFDAVEGVRLLSDDLVRTEKDTFLRIEYEDETSIELGPQTSLQLNHPARKRANRPGLYLLEGWLKLGSGKQGAGRTALASPGMDIVELAGVIVVQATDASHAIFTEEGTARWVDRSERDFEPITLKQGDFLVVGAEKAPKIRGRPTADFMSALPRAYRDTLPFRYGTFKSHEVLPKGHGTFSYADVQPWIDAEPSVRRQFVVTWHRKADHADFRAGLDRDLPKHPEWEPVLHPELYETSAPPPAGAAMANPPSPPPPASIPATPVPKH